MKSYINFNDGSSLTEISPILTCIRTLKESECLWDRDKLQQLKRLSLQQLKEETIPSEDGFYFAVSLQDGSILYMSSAITTHLGYPKDMLVGQCIMNFLYQKDHITFANHLTQGLNACFIQGKRDDSHLVPNAFFCRLREYRGLKYGYSLSDKKTQYKPFKVTLHINDLIFDDMCVEKCSSTLCVNSTATPVTSAYTVPEEIPAMSSFSTRHTASCHFSHVDASAIPYLGYLPQDMIGYSVFDFYHLDDMPQLKDIYELVVKEKGSSFRSKPYSFRVQNGCYILLETEWSCFINPWSRKLEFIVGQHRVLKGPTDVNIFNLCEEEDKTVSDEIMKESLSIQNEIKKLLSQPIPNPGGERKRSCNKRKRDLASFVYNCIDRGYDWSKQQNSEKLNLMDDGSNSDSESIVMGDISPYREVNDSSSSTDTAQTMQQMRCQENIERFFASQPKTYSDASDEYNKSEKCSTGEEGSSGTSGNASKDQTPTDTYATGYDNKVQESSSGSSKCDLSTGDSGYKSLEKDNQPTVPNTGMSNLRWNDSDACGNEEKLSTCMALTEETLCVHNRANHKLSKHRKSKIMPVLSNNANHKECNWMQQSEPTRTVSHKHKKSSHTPNMTDSTLTMTETVKMTSGSQPAYNFNLPFSMANASTTAAHPQMTDFAHEQQPYLFSPRNMAAATPAPSPFFIPVVYMGTMPYYPPIANVLPPTAASFWSGVQPNQFPMPTSVFTPHSNLNPFGIQASGVTTTSLSTTTTTTLASDMLSNLKNTTLGGLSSVGPSGMKAPVVKTDVKGLTVNLNKDDMQTDDTSSFLTSSSQASTDKEEDMDIEVDFPKKYRPRVENCDLSPEVVFRYQMALPSMDDVLKKDLELLRSMQQPELVNRQLEILQKELNEENEVKVHTESDFYVTESIMLGLTTEEDVKEELEHWEECHLPQM